MFKIISQLMRCALLTGGTPVLLFLSGCSVSQVDLPPRDNAPAAVANTHDTPTTGPLTLDGAIVLAVENNPSLRADYAGYEAMLLDVPQARSLPDPMAEIARQQTFSGMTEDETMVGVSQMFPWFGKRKLMGRMARAEAMEALEMYHMNFLDVRREVTMTWYMLAFEREDLILTQDDLQLLTQSLEATTALYDTGQSGRDAMLRAQTEIARVESMLPEYDARIVELERRLTRLISVYTGTFEAVLPAEEISLPNDDALLAEAMFNRPELERYAQQELAGELALRLAKADYYPDFTVGGGYISMTESDGWSASAGINIPIPNSRRRAARDQANKRIEEASLRRRAAEEEISEQLISAITRARALQRQADVLRDSILPLAEETNATANIGYATGQTSYLELLDTQRIYIAARRDLLRVRRDRELAIADLERAVGAPLSAIQEIEK